MRRVLKWIGGIVGVLLVIVVVAAVALSIVGGSRLNKTRDITAESITIPTDAESLARGEHLVDAICRDCHTPNLTGQAFIEDGVIGAIHSANITGLAETHSDEEIVRAIRHGVDTDGRQLIIMPAEAFINFSESDLASIIAYLKTVPRAGEERPEPELALVGRAMLGAGMFGDVFPAEYIDHDMPFPAMPEIGANAAYGEYFAQLCSLCHGDNLAGGAGPELTAPNLTPAGSLGSWSQEDFLRTINTGITPDGRQLDPEQMPWQSFSKLSDDELTGIWLYLQSLPPTETE